MEGSVALPVGLDALARHGHEQRSAADGLRGRRMPGVGVEQVGLDERDPDVLGDGVGEQRPDPGPRAVRADQQARDDRGAVGERHLVAPVAEGTDTADLVPPPDRAGRERVEQDPAQLTALHLGAFALAVVVEQYGPVRGEDAGRLAAFQDEGAELVGQPRRLQCGLAGGPVYVEHPALRAGRR